MNRVESIVDGRKVANRITGIASQFLGVKVTPLGYVFEDPAVSRSVHEQEPFIRLFPKTKASQCVEHIARVLENVEVSEKGGLNKFISTIFGSNQAGVL